MKKEFSVKPLSGYLALLIVLLFIGGAIAGYAYELIWLGVICTVLFILMTIGFTVVNPNESCVMILFGAYKGKWIFLGKSILLQTQNISACP